MILIAGLSPAWQQIVLLSKMTVGEVNRAREVHWCASGKAVNVAIAVQHLIRSSRSGSGAMCQLLTLRGGPTGDLLARELEQFQIPCHWVSTECATRVCTTLLDTGSATTTEIVENAGAISSDELAEFQRIFCAVLPKVKTIVLTGSLPAGTPASLYGDLLQRAEHGRSIVDAQGELLLQACRARPFLVKPNREELGRTLQCAVASEEEVWQAMVRLQNLGAANVLVTDGARDVRLCFDTRRFRFTPRNATVVNPIGSGDCLAAGIAWGLDAGCDLVESVRRGLSAAAGNAEQLLPSRLNAERLLSGAAKIKVQELH